MSDDRYERRRLLGRGGFGEVWLAYDRQLRRDVAIKSLTSTHPDDRARFEREARLAAALQHPNIVPVHDVGDGFLVMEFVDGVSADQAKPSPREAAELIRQAADAVAHAHGRGVVHRDLKPANILVAGARAFVTDFGLAKQVGAASSLSMTGDIFGTPSFMAPEQALGSVSEVGPRSDVFSLGSTLYALLAGRAPFLADDTFGVLRKVVDEEPPPLPDSIDRDLRVIVGRAMEKFPARRYDSAADLAADLGRYLAGEPILARPATVMYRLRRQVRRNPWAWRIGAAAFVGAVAVVVWGAVQQRANARRDEAQRLLREAESWHAAALTAALAGDPDGDAMMREFEASSRAARALDPSIAEPWFQRARYARLLGDEDEAWRCVKAGLALEGSAPMGRLEQGMLLLADHRRLFRQRYDAAVSAEAREAVLQQRARREIRPADVDRRFPEVVALRERALAEIAAGTSAQETERRKPWVKLAMADLDLLRGEHQSAVDQVRDLGYAAAKVTLGRIAEQAGERSSAENYYRIAVDIQPSYWEAHEELAHLLQQEALAMSMRGDPKAESMAETVLIFLDRFLGRRPGHERATISKAHTLNLMGAFRYEAGVDPTSCHEAALDAALPLADRSEVAADIVGTAYWGLGRWKIEHGADGEAAIRKSVEVLEGACGRLPDSHNLRQHLGQARLQLAGYEASRGDDAEQAFRAAVAEFEHAVHLWPDDSESQRALGVGLLWWAEWMLQRGADPSEICARARICSDAAVKLQGGNDDARCNGAVASIVLGDWRLSRGVDPTEAYREAVGIQDDILTRRPTDAWVLVGKGNALLGIGRWRLSQGDDPSASFAASTACYDGALEAYPRDALALNNRGNAYLLWSKWDRAARRDPTEHLALAVASFDESLNVKEADAAVHANRGLALDNLGDWEMINLRDPVPSCEAAIRAYDRALEIDRAFLPALNNRGNSFAQWARWLAAHEREHEEQVRRAFESFDGALSINEAYWEAHVNKGLLLEDLGRAKEALASYEAALRHNPDHPTIRELVDRLR